MPCLVVPVGSLPTGDVDDLEQVCSGQSHHLHPGTRSAPGYHDAGMHHDATVWLTVLASVTTVHHDTTIDVDATHLGVSGDRGN